MLSVLLSDYLKGLNLVGSTGTNSSISDTAANATKASNAINDLGTKIKNLVTQNKLAIESAAEFNAELRSIQAQFSKTGDINAFNKAMNTLKNMSRMSIKKKSVLMRNWIR